MAAELSRQGVRKILISHIGEGAKRAMGAFGIEVIPVSEGPIAEVIQSYLSSLTH
jgi:predicted Fe-Mo cluster-binding NifX family protein